MHFQMSYMNTKLRFQVGLGLRNFSSAPGPYALLGGTPLYSAAMTGMQQLVTHPLLTGTVPVPI